MKEEEARRCKLTFSKWESAALKCTKYLHGWTLWPQWCLNRTNMLHFDTFWKERYESREGNWNFKTYPYVFTSVCNGLNMLLEVRVIGTWSNDSMFIFIVVRMGGFDQTSVITIIVISLWDSDPWNSYRFRVSIGFWFHSLYIDLVRNFSIYLDFHDLNASSTNI